MKALALVLPLLVATPAAAGEAWLEVLDIPLMPGLDRVPDGETVFESGGGRVVQVEATGAVAAEAVRRYYEGALPGLGWRPAGAGGYGRAGERLEVSVNRSGEKSVVTFRLMPSD